MIAFFYRSVSNFFEETFPKTFPKAFVRAFVGMLLPMFLPLFLPLFLLLCLAVVSCLPSEARAQSLPSSGGMRLDFLRIGTGPAERTLYRLGSALTGSLSAPPGIEPPCRQDSPCGVPGLLLVAQSRSGAFESLEDMARGRLESALVPADVLDEVRVLGSETYAFDMREVMLLARLASVQLHVVVLDSSSVQSLSDLVGRTVAVGLSGSASSSHLRRALASENINIERVVVVPLSLRDGLKALAAGQVDALVASGQVPLPSLRVFAQNSTIRLVNISTEGDLAKRFFNANRGIARPTVLPAQTYEGQQKVWHTLSFDVLWVVSRAVSEEVVYRLTRSLWHGSTQRIMQTLVPELKIDRPYRYRSALLPLHPGAARWYAEQGLLDS